jgi:lipid-A-disaccharide synthase-like uncharacterized protein
MMAQVAQILGFIGTLIVAIGYLPQIVHIAREGCSAGVSVNAWYLWLLASVLVFTHAFMVVDVVFVALQTVNIFAIMTIIVLAKRYEHMVCKIHEQHAAAG